MYLTIIILDKGYHLYFDNFFTSPDLQVKYSIEKLIVLQLLALTEKTFLGSYQVKLNHFYVGSMYPPLCLVEKFNVSFGKIKNKWPLSTQ